ncbi:MAG: 3-dehydroquinate synthase [Osedax symbiont Rs1]|nr:MAG: 3-dehydroquinate synthase [Osedax symbiont Rs1]
MDYFGLFGVLCLWRNTLNSLRVELGSRSYPIYIGSDILQKMDITKYIHGQQVMIVSNETVAALYMDKVCAIFANSAFKLDRVVLPDGEQYKNLQHVNLIFDQLLTAQHNRTTTLIALGGGVIGDMTGFAAACYQRGVNFIQMPTTLLSQVDSSVGGKTGVNHPLGKNMIGAFYQPQMVVADINFFSTLPAREVSAGLAEVIKYGLIYDPEFFVWLEKNIADLLAKDVDAMCYAVQRSCEIKAEVVAVDEKEQGIRAWLNLGHTFGHAIETHQGYGNWLHGEAVAVGTVMALDLSYRLGWIDRSLLERTKKLFISANLPIHPPENMSEDDFLSIMSVDKKVFDGHIRLVLLEELGRAIVTDKFDMNLLKETLSISRKGLL